MPRARPHTPRTHPLTTPARTSVFDLHRALQDLVYQAGSLANVGSASLENLADLPRTACVPRTGTAQWRFIVTTLPGQA